MLICKDVKLHSKKVTVGFTKIKQTRLRAMLLAANMTGLSKWGLDGSAGVAFGFMGYGLCNVLYNFDQFISHTSQSQLTKQNFASGTSHKANWQNNQLSQPPKCSNFGFHWGQSNEILPLSQPSSQGDEIKISSGMSQSHMGDRLIEIVQYVDMLSMLICSMLSLLQ